MHLEFCGKESCNRGKKGTEQNTQQQCKDNSHTNGQSGKVKDMSEYTTGVDTLVHDNRSGSHTHTNHSANGKVSSGKENQTGNTKCKEHSGRCLL